MARHAMITQDFYLPKYGGWHVKVFYAATSSKARMIMEELANIGCHGVDLVTAARNLSNGKPDTGLTYSNYHLRETVMVVSITSSPAQFLNSWTHEMLHLCRHVSTCFGLDPYGEETAYLSGTVAQKMFPVAKKFLCEHCRNNVT